MFSKTGCNKIFDYMVITLLYIWAILLQHKLQQQSYTVFIFLNIVTCNACICVYCEGVICPGGWLCKQFVIRTDLPCVINLARHPFLLYSAHFHIVFNSVWRFNIYTWFSRTIFGCFVALSKYITPRKGTALITLFFVLVVYIQG